MHNSENMAEANLFILLLFLRHKDPELYSYLQQAELGTIFALPWLITWFGHVLPNYENMAVANLFILLLFLRHKDPELYSYLQQAELGTIFALPWLITWFGHVLPDYGDVVRLYDYFLAQPPLMPVYLAAAIVLYRRQDILSSGREDCSIP
jgi:Rab-GTPase-TBC domain